MLGMVFTNISLDSLCVTVHLEVERSKEDQLIKSDDIDIVKRVCKSV